MKEIDPKVFEKAKEIGQSQELFDFVQVFRVIEKLLEGKKEARETSYNAARLSLAIQLQDEFGVQLKGTDLQLNFIAEIFGVRVAFSIRDDGIAIGTDFITIDADSLKN